MSTDYSYKVTKKNGRRVPRERYGTYTGKTPKQAAQKAFTAIAKKATRRSKSPGGRLKDIVFCIERITRGSDHKEFCYKGRQVKLRPARRVVINGREVVYRTESRVFRWRQGEKRKGEQGFNARKDEQLGMTRGAERSKTQSPTSRRREARGTRKPRGSYGLRSGV